MAFTTKQILKSDKPEIYPGKTVLIQHSYNVEEGTKTNTYFTLNKDAIEAFGMKPYTANVNNITWGIDDVTKDLMLAAIDGDAKSSRVTAENKFSNGLFMDKLVKQFNIDPVTEHVFELDIYEESGIFVATIKPLVEATEVVIEEPYVGFDKMHGLNGEVEDTTSFDRMVNEIHNEPSIAGDVDLF